MKNDDRLHRPDPQRTGPIRKFSNLYQRPDTTDRLPGSEESSAIPSPSAAKSSDALTRGVNLAYQVIEKYIAEGRRTAEQLARQPYNTRAITTNLQQLGEIMLRYSTEMMPIWLEMARTLVTSGAALSGGIPSSPSPSPGGISPSVSIELASKHPVRVWVDLRSNVDPRSLVVLGLRTVDSEKPELTEVALVPPSNGGPPTLRVRVPDNQPSGVYSGVVVDRNTGEPRGTLTVTVVDVE